MIYIQRIKVIKMVQRVMVVLMALILVATIAIPPKKINAFSLSGMLPLAEDLVPVPYVGEAALAFVVGAAAYTGIKYGDKLDSINIGLNSTTLDNYWNSLTSTVKDEFNSITSGLDLTKDNTIPMTADMTTAVHNYLLTAVYTANNTYSIPTYNYPSSANGTVLPSTTGTASAEYISRYAPIYWEDYNGDSWALTFAGSITSTMQMYPFKLNKTNNTWVAANSAPVAPGSPTTWAGAGRLIPNNDTTMNVGDVRYVTSATSLQTLNVYTNITGGTSFQSVAPSALLMYKNLILDGQSFGNVSWASWYGLNDMVMTPDPADSQAKIPANAIQEGVATDGSKTYNPVGASDAATATTMSQSWTNTDTQTGTTNPGDPGSGNRIPWAPLAIFAAFIDLMRAILEYLIRALTFLGTLPLVPAQSLGNAGLDYFLNFDITSGTGMFGDFFTNVIPIDLSVIEIVRGLLSIGIAFAVYKAIATGLTNGLDSYSIFTLRDRLKDRIKGG
jgi:hypothetical protein